jgi:AraC-like DNA-binding protein
MAGRDAELDNNPHSDIAAESALPADLVRALAWLRSHLSEGVNLEQLALVAGVRPRTLESHFKVFLGTTPLGWLRRMRLAHARRELERVRDATVTGIALGSGFNQLGRFAAYYRTVFGEAPSTTLQRSRHSRGGGGDDIDDEALRLTWQAMPNVFAIAPRECNEALAILDSVRQMAPNYIACRSRYPRGVGPSARRTDSRPLPPDGIAIMRCSWPNRRAEWQRTTLLP